jgi:hypothetical protein
MDSVTGMQTTDQGDGEVAQGISKALLVAAMVVLSLNERASVLL